MTSLAFILQTTNVFCLNQIHHQTHMCIVHGIKPFMYGRLLLKTKTTQPQSKAI